MPGMETSDWAKTQLADIAARRKALNTELATLDRLEHHFKKLLPETPNPVTEAKAVTGRRNIRASKPTRVTDSGAVTPQVLKALENGPMSVDELAQALNRKVKTGVSSVVRFQQRAGTIVAVADNKYALSPSAAADNVLVA